MEDEVIRKEFCEDIWNSFPYEKAHKYIAWLEKQVSPQMVADAYLIGCNDTEKKWLEKQGEQKSVLDFKASNWYVSKVDGKIHDMTYNPKSVEWSEEDERLMILSRKFLDDAKHIDYGEFEHKKEIEECMAWLKLIKERIKRIKGAVVSVHNIK